MLYSLLRDIFTGALIAALMFVIYDDMINFRIMNRTVLIVLCLASLIILISHNVREILFYVGVGLCSFAALFFVWARGWIGGGDAKLLTIAFLWHGERAMTDFSILLVVFTFAYWIGAKARILPHRRLNSGRTAIPYGPAIGLAWIVTIVGSSIVGFQ